MATSGRVDRDYRRANGGNTRPFTRFQQQTFNLQHAQPLEWCLSAAPLRVGQMRKENLQGDAFFFQRRLFFVKSGYCLRKLHPLALEVLLNHEPSFFYTTQASRT